MTLPLKQGRTFIIAEAGTNHADLNTEKRFAKALEYVETAANCGADAVKFQWFWTGIDNYIPLQKDMFCWLDGDEARAPTWRASVMDIEAWLRVKEYTEACGLAFLASAFQTSTVEWLVSLKLAATKVASRAAKNFPYDAPGLPEPIIVSEGMQPFILPQPFERFIILQCESKYPSTLRYDRGRVHYHTDGFSDHSGKPFLGIEAISDGCPMLEVHYMIDRLDAGPNLPACLSVQELKLLCQARDYYANRRA